MCGHDWHASMHVDVLIYMVQHDWMLVVMIVKYSMPLHLVVTLSLLVHYISMKKHSFYSISIWDLLNQVFLLLPSSPFSFA